jgi:hypothetical protein
MLRIPCCNFQQELSAIITAYAQNETQRREGAKIHRRQRGIERKIDKQKNRAK